MKNLPVLLLICAGVLVAGYSSAGAARLSPAIVEKVSKFAHDGLAGAKIGNGELIGPEKAKTLAYPLVDYDTREKTIGRGYLAGAAEACGMDWQSLFYNPYMVSVRAAHKDWNDYQFAYVGLLHGVSMTLAEKYEGQSCTEEEKAKLIELSKK